MMPCSFTSLIIVLLCSIYCAHAVLTATTLPIYYISYTTTLPQVSLGEYQFTMSDFRYVDDSPYLPLILPFPFLLGPRFVKAMWVNPNGALHGAPGQACYPDNTFGTLSCGLNNNYYNVIAGYLVDLDANQCPGAVVKVYRYLRTSPSSSTPTNNAHHNDSMSVLFENYCYYNSTSRNTFSMTLFSDHHIELHYHNLTADTVHQRVGGYISGFRYPRLYTQISTLQLDTAQARAVNNVWRTTAGVYPLTTREVVTGRRFIICPLATVFSMSPKQVLLPSNLNTPMFLELSSVLMPACVSKVNLTVLYTTTLFANRLLCTANRTVIRCDLHPLLVQADSFFSAHTNVRNLSLLVSLQWAPPAVPWNITVIPMKAFTMVVYPSGSTTPAGTCMVNNVDTCIVPSLCDGNQTCYKNTCTNLTAHPITYNNPDLKPALYPMLDTLDCNNLQCNHEISSNTNGSGTFVKDSQNYCCPVTDLDCAGMCASVNPFVRVFPNTLAVNDGNTSVTCCSWPNRVDCQGVCAGKVVLDACGVCNGTDFIGLSCFNPDDVVLSTQLIQLQHTLPLLSSSDRIYISNNSSSNITYSLALFGAVSSKYPKVVFDSAAQVMPINTTNSFDISFSLQDVLNKSITLGFIQEWEAKVLRLTYYRNVYPASKFTMDIEIQPTVSGCDYLGGDIKTCMGLPGCFYCLTYERMRIIKTNRHSHILNAQIEPYVYTGPTARQQVAEEEQDRRRLFSSIVPAKFSNKYHELLAGVCRDGWEQDVCASIHDPHITGSGNTRGTGILVAMSVVWASVLVLLA